MRVHLPKTVRGDWPIGHHLVAEAGYHEAVENPLGAVCVVLPDGKLLGVKPDEFERVEDDYWADQRYDDALFGVPKGE